MLRLALFIEHQLSPGISELPVHAAVGAAAAGQHGDDGWNGRITSVTTNEIRRENDRGRMTKRSCSE